MAAMSSDLLYESESTLDESSIIQIDNCESMELPNKYSDCLNNATLTFVENDDSGAGVGVFSPNQNCNDTIESSGNNYADTLSSSKAPLNVFASPESKVTYSSQVPSSPAITRRGHQRSLSAASASSSTGSKINLLMTSFPSIQPDLIKTMNDPDIRDEQKWKKVYRSVLAVKRDEENADFLLGRFRLRFHDSVLEHAFSAYYGRRYLSETRLWLLVITISFSVTMFALFNSELESNSSLFLLLGIYVILLFCFFVVSFMRCFRASVQLLSVAMIASTGTELLVFAFITNSMSSMKFVILYLVFFVAANTFVRLRLYYASVVALYLFALFDVLYGIKLDNSSDSVINFVVLNLGLFVAWVSVLRAAYDLECSERIEFARCYAMTMGQGANNSTTQSQNPIDASIVGPSSLRHAISHRVPNGNPRVSFESFPITLHPNTSGDVNVNKSSTNNGNQFFGNDQVDSSSEHGVIGSEVSSAYFDELYDLDESATIPSLQTAVAVVKAAWQGALDSAVNVKHSASDLSQRAAIFVKEITSGKRPITDIFRFKETIAEESTADDRVREFVLLTSDELPSWFEPYYCIPGNYRVGFTKELCWKSIFKLHNETLNIWTEFIPVIIFVIMTIVYCTQYPFQAASQAIQVILVVGMVGHTIVRPLCSGLAHLLHCQSQRHFIFWWRIDYFSICISIFCASIVSGRYSFWCWDSGFTFFLVAAVALLLSTILSVLYIASGAIRAGSFVLFVLFTQGVPYFYQVYLITVSSTTPPVPFSYMLKWSLGLALTVMGLVVKSIFVPERFFPGKCDIWFQSHTMWHLFINSSHGCAVSGWLDYLSWRFDNMTCPPS